MWKADDRVPWFVAMAVPALWALLLPSGAAAQSPGAADAVPSAGCALPAQEVPSELTVRSGGIDRLVLLHLPGGVPPATPAPLVLAFHGYGGGAYDQEAMSGLSVVADAAGFVVAYPSGVGSPPQWEMGGDRDTAFASDVIDALGGLLCLDERRVSATGFSMGGGMAIALGCRLADRIAAIAPVAGVHGPDIEGPCEPSRPVPLLAFHGMADPAVPYAGGPLPDPVWGGRSASGVEAWAAAWAARNGCAAEPDVAVVSDEVDRLTWAACGAPVEVYRVTAGEHAWPGGANDPAIGVTTDDIAASELMAEFFAANPLP